MTFDSQLWTLELVLKVDSQLAPTFGSYSIEGRCYRRMGMVWKKPSTTLGSFSKLVSTSIKTSFKFSILQ